MSIELKPLEANDREQFITDNQEAFNYGALEEFGKRDDHFEEGSEIISHKTIEQSIDGGEAYRIIQGDKKVGGLVLRVNGNKGELDLLFVSPKAHSKGIGYAAWCAVEKLHPEVKVWETVTPYFEKRNIHFYVNRCGFHIVEFFNSHHTDPNEPYMGKDPDEQFPDGMFRFEKRLNMDQQKIGSFLKALRCEKGLTQAVLAEQLNTTNRSISRWETGNTMPDISILIELAEFYQVDIKEILNGERQSEKMNEDVKVTAEKVAEYSKKANKKKITKVVTLMIIPIIVLTALLVIVFSSRSVQVLPNIYPAYQQVTIDSKVTEKLINDYVTGHMPEAPVNSHNFSNIKVFSVEEKQSEDYYVYAWVYEAAYSYNDGVLTEESCSSYPCRFELIKENESFRVVNADVPRDGYYIEDRKKLFPGYVIEMIETVQEDGTVRTLSDKTLADAKAYFNVK